VEVNTNTEVKIVFVYAKPVESQQQIGVRETSRAKSRKMPGGEKQISQV